MDNKALIAIAITMMVAVPIGLGYLLNFDDVDSGSWKAGDERYVTSYINNDRLNDYTPYTGIFNNYWGFFDQTTNSGKLGFDQLDFVTTGSTYSSVPILGEGTPTTITSTGAAIDLAAYGGDRYKVAFDNHPAHTYTIAFADGSSSVEMFPAISGSGDPDAIIIQKMDNYAIIETTRYDNVVSIKMSITSGYDVKIIPIVDTSTYADVADGWYVDANIQFSWRNLQSNYSVTMLADIPVSTSFYLYDLYLTNEYTQISRDASGFVTIQQFDGIDTISYDLGNYQYVQINKILFGTSSISGIAAWPDLGTYAAPLNTIELENTLYFNLMQTSSDQIHFRVDRVEILNSTYAAATDRSFSIGDIDPMMDSYYLNIKYLNFPGTSLTFAGNTYNVSGNQLIVGTKRVDINNLVISSRSDDGVTWNNYIGDRFISSTAAPQKDITLTGSWSAQYTIQSAVFQHQLDYQWVTGHMGIDMSDAALIGLATCAACFIFLGMTGRASGSKALILAVICGGAAMIFITLI